jgi:hypothetical protein
VQLASSNCVRFGWGNLLIFYFYFIFNLQRSLTKKGVKKMADDNYLNLRVENVPAWYELSWDQPNHSLLLKVHQDVIDLLKKLSLVQYLSKELNLSLDSFVPFVDKDQENFGFSGLIKRVDNVDPFSVYQINLANFHRKDLGYWSLSASLNLAFSVLEYLDRSQLPAPYNRNQLMIYQLYAKRSNLDGAGLSALLAPEFVNWLDKFEINEKIIPASEAMVEAYVFMSKTKKKDRRWFTSRTYAGILGLKKRLLLNCEGNACDLGPDYLEHKLQEVEGYELWPHNVDSVIQQFTLLVGLASLCDLCRADLYSEAS